MVQSPWVMGRHAHILEWIPEKDVPRGIGVRYDSYVIPLPGSIRQFYARQKNGWSIKAISLRKIQNTQTKVGESLVATINFSESRPTSNPVVSRGRSRVVKVRIGEKLTVGKDKWFVRNIVPHDKERHINGWVEISPVRRKQRPAVVEHAKDILTLRVAEKKDALKSPQAWLSDTFKAKDGKLWMAGVWTLGPRPELRNICRELGTVKFGNSPFTTGDIIPLYGRIYRVESIRKSKVVFRIATDKELPKGAKPKSRSLVVPFRRTRGGHSRLTSRKLQPDGLPHLHAEMYDTGANVRGLVPVVRLYGRHPRLIRGCGAKIGGRYGLLQGFDVEVLNVVKPDEKQGVIGWVELKPL